MNLKTNRFHLLLDEQAAPVFEMTDDITGSSFRSEIVSDFERRIRHAQIS